MDLTSKLGRKLSQISNFRRMKQLQQKVDEARTAEAAVYNEHPKMSMILQFFNKRQNIGTLMKALRQTSAEELIIIDDGSMDGSYTEWMQQLTRPNDFLLRCNDIFEVRTYDRAMRMAKGEFICLLQDDDIPPLNNTWIEQALKLFEIFPDLLILGGRGGLDFFLPDPINPNEEPVYKQVGDMGGCPGVNKHRIYETPLYIEPITGIPFMFTTSVNRAPTFLRREKFLALGGINQAYAPFQFDDDDACVRAWLAGCQVGLYACPFIRNVGTGGMRLFNSERVAKQAAINAQRFYGSYSKYIENGYLQTLVDRANQCLTPRSEPIA